MTDREAFDRLVAAGYLVDNGAGWHYAARPPTKRDLAWYVAAVTKLGAWSVPTSTPARVRLSTGNAPDEVLFARAGAPVTTPAAPRMQCPTHGIVEAQWDVPDSGPVAYCPICRAPCAALDGAK